MRAHTHVTARVMSAVAGLCFRHARLCLLLLAISVAGALGAARSLRINSDLVSLLPERSPSVQGLREYQARGGTVGFVAIVLRGTTEEKLVGYAEALEPHLRSLEAVDYVAHERPSAFFEERALYYLDVEDLEDLAERVEDRVNWERRRANPLLVNLEDEGPPSVGIDPKTSQLPPGLVQAAESPNYFDAEQGALLILVKPKRLASDLGFARKVVGQVREVLRAHGPKEPGIEVQLGGRFSKRVAQQEMLNDDLRTASLASLLLVLVYLALHFRRLSGVLVALVPLLVGLSWTFGLTALLFGELNILTAFVGAILVGLGIDHGLHLVERYSGLRDQGLGPHDAVMEAFSGTGQAVMLAAVTTALGFLALGASEFRAFREFGLICAMGGGLVMLAFSVCLPALLAIFPQPRAVSSQGRRRAGPFSILAGTLARRPGTALVVSTAVGLGAFSQIGALSFNYDFAELDARTEASVALDRDIDGLLGHQQASLAILTRDEAEAHAAALTLRARRQAGGTSIDFVLSARDLVPTRQADKQAILRRMAKQVQGLDVDTLPKQERVAVNKLRRMAEVPPFSKADLPRAVKKELALGAEQTGGLVLVFPSVRMSDGEAILGLAEELTDIPVGAGQTVNGTGEAMVLADVLTLVFQETPRALMMTVVSVFLCLWVFLKDPRRAGLAYAPAVVSVAVTLGLCAATGLRLNYLNVVFIPVLFGMAVDSGVHLVQRRIVGAHGLEHLAETSRAIFGASLTTAAGFGTLGLAHHPGLRSLGQLALLGITVSLVVSLIWLIALMFSFGPPGDDPEPGDARQTPPPTQAVV